MKIVAIRIYNENYYGGGYWRYNIDNFIACLASKTVRFMSKDFLMGVVVTTDLPEISPRGDLTFGKETAVDLLNPTNEELQYLEVLYGSDAVDAYKKALKIYKKNT